MKRSIWIVLVIVVIGAVGLLVSDILQAKRAMAIFNQLQLNITKIESENEVEIVIKRAGEVPESPMVLTIFADNRYLELQPQGWSDDDVVTFLGQKAGGVESRFVIPSHFDGEMSLRYNKKEKSSSTPLIYAYLESEVNGLVFSDTELRTKIFNLQNK